MRLVTFIPRDGPIQAGVLHGDDAVVPAGPALSRADVVPEAAAVGMIDVLERWPAAKEVLAAAAEAPVTATVPLKEVRLAAPLPRPRNIRDFYAFEEHVKRGAKRRGADVPKAWYEAPVFYFTNPDAVLGPGDEVVPPRATKALDYELEVAWVTGVPLRDATAKEAREAIVGLTIMNDWSARDIQRREMAVGLGPSKGKDFATSLGPAIVTVDGFAPRATDKAFDLAMTARVNGETLSRGNLRDLHYSLGEMTAHAAADTTLYPGDVLATGTVGTGSLLDLGREPGGYLAPGDVVELEVEGLGVLRSRVASAPTRR